MGGKKKRRTPVVIKKNKEIWNSKEGYINFLEDPHTPTQVANKNNNNNIGRRTPNATYKN